MFAWQSVHQASQQNKRAPRARSKVSCFSGSRQQCQRRLRLDWPQENQQQAFVCCQNVRGPPNRVASGLFLWMLASLLEGMARSQKDVQAGPLIPSDTQRVVLANRITTKSLNKLSTRLVRGTPCFRSSQYDIVRHTGWEQQPRPGYD